MATEIEFLRDQVRRLNSALRRYQDDPPAAPTSTQVEDVVLDPPSLWPADRSHMAPLIAEYDRHIAQMETQLRHYQRQMADIKVNLEQVVKENEDLHAEQRLSIERQLQTLPAGLEAEFGSDSLTMKNMQEQLKCSLEEKEQAVQMWQEASQELDRLQRLYQNTMSQSQMQTADRQHAQKQLMQAQQHVQNLQSTNQKLELTNQQFLHTVTEQSSDLEELRGQLRQAKLDLRTATTKVDEMTRLMQNVQDQMQRKEEDAAEAHGREEASDRRLQQLQTALSQVESRLKVAVQDGEALRREHAVRERHQGELQTRCASLEEERHEALTRVRHTLQLVEEASLQREQAQLKEKQRTEELEQMKAAMKQLIQDAATRTRKEVDNVRQQCNIQIQRMAEELSALQLECTDKESQIERSHRERKAMEEELGKVYREGRGGEMEMRKMEALHQRTLNAERLKDDMHITLQSTHTKMKKMEMEYSEELSRCQEEVQRLQGALVGVRQDCGAVSEERLQLQRENQQLHKDMEELRRTAMLTQRQAKQQVRDMEQELRVRAQGLEAQLQEQEESRRCSSAELTRLLLAQRRTSTRWRDEAKRLTEALQHRAGSLRSELSRQRQRSQELELQLEGDHNKLQEYERLLAEQQERSRRLEQRLAQAEQRASSTSQQLSMMTQRRKASSLADLESV